MDLPGIFEVFQLAMVKPSLLIRGTGITEPQLILIKDVPENPDDIIRTVDREKVSLLEYIRIIEAETTLPDFDKTLQQLFMN